MSMGIAKPNRFLSKVVEFFASLLVTGTFGQTVRLTALHFVKQYAKAGKNDPGNAEGMCCGWDLCDGTCTDANAEPSCPALPAHAEPTLVT